jgi:hypothetical protein
MNDLIFDGNIDETEVGLLPEGMPLTLTIGALQNLTFDASLEYISPQATKKNGANQFEIKAAVQANNAQIRSGYSANAKICCSEHRNVIAVPEGTVEFTARTPMSMCSPPDVRIRTSASRRHDGHERRYQYRDRKRTEAGDMVRGDGAVTRRDE